MDDLVERLLAIRAYNGGVIEATQQAAARIQALETSLAEAEGRVIAEVVAWLRAYKRDDTNWPQVLATAIETGEHLKDSQASGDAV